jgi:hypothetical protein
MKKAAPKNRLDRVAVLANQGVAGAAGVVVAGLAGAGVEGAAGVVVVGAAGVVVVVDVAGADGAGVAGAGVGVGVAGAGVAGAAGVVVVVVEVVFEATGVAGRFIIKITTMRMTMMTAAAPMIVFRLFIVFPPAELASHNRQDASEGCKRLTRLAERRWEGLLAFT